VECHFFYFYNEKLPKKKFEKNDPEKHSWGGASGLIFFGVNVGVIRVCSTKRQSVPRWSPQNASPYCKELKITEILYFIGL
jgi:hypothetical protein